MLQMIRTYVRSLVRDEKGATAIEYALMAALIAVVIIGAVSQLGGNAATAFSNIASAVT